MESFRFEDESPQKLVLLLTLNEVKPSPDREMVKFLTFDDMFCRHDILVKLVVECRRLPRFPAKMTLVHAQAVRTLLSTEKISYS